MSIFHNCYQTTIGSAFVTKHIETSIKKLLIQGIVYSLDVDSHGTYKPMFITGLSYLDSEVPLFTHPITINLNAEEKYLCTDLRMYVNKTGDWARIEDRVKNKTEFNFTKSRAILNLLWLNEGPSALKNNLAFAGSVFAAWLSDVISKTYALDFKDQTTLTIITSFYYQTLFTDDIHFDDDVKQKMAVHTIKATKAPAAFVFEVFDRIETMTNIESYIENVKSILENVRLQSFNLGMLVTIIKNSWYGINSKDIIAVAIEHPPTWAAMVYTALNERTYKSSMIYRVAERLAKRGEGDEFIKNYVGLIQQQQRVSVEDIDDDPIVFLDFE